MKFLSLALLLFLIPVTNGYTQEKSKMNMPKKVTKTEDEWKMILTKTIPYSASERN
jgi:hypothetical protein